MNFPQKIPNLAMNKNTIKEPQSLPSGCKIFQSQG